MSIRSFQDIEVIKGNEGTKIRQIFHPHNTLNGIRYSLAHFTLEPGKRSLSHKLKSSEIYFILEGSGKIHVEKEEIQVKQNDSVFISPMSKQFIENTGTDDLKFLCVVDPAWRQEDELIED